MIKKLRNGFGLIQTLVTVTMIGAVLGIAIPAARDALIMQSGRASTANLQIIEAAKRSFVINNPGVDLTNVSQLLPFLPNNQMPPPAQTGEVYLNTTSLTQLSASSVNGNPAFEPWSTNYGSPTNNGFNDLGAATPALATTAAPTTFVPTGNMSSPFSVLRTTYVDPFYTITIAQAANGTSVFADNGLTNTENIPAGTSAHIIATAIHGYKFVSWSDGSTNADYSFIPSSDATLTPVFTQAGFFLTTAVTPTNGGTISPASGGLYMNNATINVIAIATDTNHVFNSLTISPYDAGVTIAGPTATVVMDKDRTATANFDTRSDSNNPYISDAVLFSPAAIFRDTPTTVTSTITSSLAGSATTHYWFDTNALGLAFDITAPTNQVTTNQNITFHGSPSNYPVTGYAASGTYFSSTNASITVLDVLPNVTLVAGTNNVRRGTGTSFTVTSSDISGLAVADAFSSPAWSGAVSNNWTTNIVFTNSGTFTNTVVATGPFGATNKASVVITVVGILPTVSLTVSPSNPITVGDANIYYGQTATFTISSSDISGLPATDILHTPIGDYMGTNNWTTSMIFTNNGLVTNTVVSSGPYGDTSSATVVLNISYLLNLQQNYAYGTYYYDTGDQNAWWNDGTYWYTVRTTATYAYETPSDYNFYNAITGAYLGRGSQGAIPGVINHINQVAYYQWAIAGPTTWYTAHPIGGW